MSGGRLEEGKGKAAWAAAAAAQLARIKRLKRNTKPTENFPLLLLPPLAFSNIYAEAERMEWKPLQRSGGQEMFQANSNDKTKNEFKTTGGYAAREKRWFVMKILLNRLTNTFHKQCQLVVVPHFFG